MTKWAIFNAKGENVTPDGVHAEQTCRNLAYGYHIRARRLGEPDTFDVRPA